MTLKTKNIAILMLFAFVFTTSYTISEVSATTPNYHGHKWFWEETDYRYGTLNGLNGLTEAEVESGIDAC